MLKTLSIILFTFLLKTTIAQNIDEVFLDKGEVCFETDYVSKQELLVLTNIVSIDRVSDGKISAYANKKSFSLFLNLNKSYTIIPSPSESVKLKMYNRVYEKGENTWDAYPTYAAYESMMYQFELDYPELCKIEEIGVLSSGRKLLAIRINDSINAEQTDPEFLYSSAMHGDEPSSYVLMLRLINHLLVNYGSDSEVTELVNNLDIYINPLANPDGLYRDNNNSISGASRGNLNYVDLNRNFPDPDAGQHPDGNNWQEETEAFMSFAERHSFVMAANFHSGVELVNYPWDTWQRRHPDDDWWQYVSRQYADTVQYYSTSGYFMNMNNGITNGYDWYRITGGRQDYMNYFHSCREFTVEISSTKMLSASLLPNLWEYHYRSLLQYMQHCRNGLLGVVVDSVTGLPLKAKIEFVGHDADSSHVYSDSATGRFQRVISSGVFDVEISSPGYKSLMLNDVAVSFDSASIIDVRLVPVSIYTDDSEFVMNEMSVFPNPTNSLFYIGVEFISQKEMCGTSGCGGDFMVEIIDVKGNLVFKRKYKIKPEDEFRLKVDVSKYPKGVYFLKVTNEQSVCSRKLIKL